MDSQLIAVFEYNFDIDQYVVVISLLDSNGCEAIDGNGRPLFKPVLCLYACASYGETFKTKYKTDYIVNLTDFEIRNELDFWLGKAKRKFELDNKLKGLIQTIALG